MEAPKIKLIADDGMSMQSELDGDVCDLLKLVEFEYRTQRGYSEVIRIYPCDLDELIEFLQKSKEYLANKK